MSCAQQLQKACSDILLARLNAGTERYAVQGLVVYPHEMAETDGLLPAFINIAEQAWIKTFGGKPRTSLRRNDSALLEFVSEFPTDGSFSVAWFSHAVAMHLSALCRQASGKEAISLEQTCKDLDKAIRAGMYELLPSTAS